MNHKEDMDNAGGQIKDVVIVGGGTAGWLSAAYLSRCLGSSVRITLVESKRIGTIGVGEGTANTFGHTMRFLGFSERDWMRRCNATYKVGISYDRWTAPSEQNPDPKYFHCFFGRPDRLIAPFDKPMFFGQSGFSIFYYWLKQHLAGVESRPFSRFCGPHDLLAESGRAPKAHHEDAEHHGGTDSELSYGYHLDATLLGGLLAERAREMGVQHKYADVVGAELDDRGYIAAIKTAEGERIPGDLFIDCTGFRRLLIGDTLGEPFKSYSSSLLCDRAVAIRRSHDLSGRGIRNHTKATALSAGWAWQIPLLSREGCGYVYSSASIDSEAAERELRAHIGVDESASALHLKMAIGRNERIWVKNCVSIGLSSAFVEPLEASTIVVMEYTLYNLLNHFPRAGFDESRIDRFNDIMVRAYDDIRDFIVLHYVLTDREDSDFWRRVRHETAVPDSLAAKLDLHRAGVVQASEFGGSPFALKSWGCILSGMAFPFNTSPPVLDHLGGEYAQSVLDAARAGHEAQASQLPDNLSALLELHGVSQAELEEFVREEVGGTAQANRAERIDSGGCR